MRDHQATTELDAAIDGADATWPASGRAPRRPASRLGSESRLADVEALNRVPEWTQPREARR